MCVFSLVNSFNAFLGHYANVFYFLLFSFIFLLFLFYSFVLV